ncbi:MAG: TlpA disulfide reductase family protein [Chitinophagaceae bacterium]
MKRVITGLLLAVLGTVVYAQTIKKGDIFSFNRKLTFEYGHIGQYTIPDLKGQHVIIDLFASGCIACFKAMPKLEVLQQQYKNRIQFLFIGKTDQQIRTIYERISKKNKLTLSVAFDSVIFDQLGVETVPLCIWINPDGSVYAVSTSAEVNVGNVENFLLGRSFRSTREISPIPFDPEKPLLMNGNGGPDSIYLMRSVLSEFVQGQRIYGPVAIPKGLPTFQVTGIPFTQIFMMAAVGAYDWSYNHPFHGNVWPQPLISESDSLLLPAKCYNYSVTVPDAGQLQEVMQNDLEKTLGWRARIEKRLMPCWKLVLKEKDTMSISSNDKYIYNDVSIGGMDVRGYSINEVMSALERFSQPGPPLINSTGVKGNINLRINALMSDMEQVRTELRKKGLDLVKGKRLMTVVILEPSVKKQVAAVTRHLFTH